MNKIRKAITGAIVTGSAALAAAAGLFTPGGENITTGEWLSVMGAVGVGFFTVWIVPNNGSSNG